LSVATSEVPAAAPATREVDYRNVTAGVLRHPRDAACAPNDYPPTATCRDLDDEPAAARWYANLGASAVAGAHNILAIDSRT
jgi:hypothetical protein